MWGGKTRETGAEAVYFENGARYYPHTDTWKPVSAVGAPKGRANTFAVWTGTEMVILGGVNEAQGGGSRFVGTGEALQSGDRQVDGNHHDWRRRRRG